MLRNEFPPEAMNQVCLVENVAFGLAELHWPPAIMHHYGKSSMHVRSCWMERGAAAVNQELQHPCSHKHVLHQTQTLQQQ
jgi:hypothetical protein